MLYLASNCFSEVNKSQCSCSEMAVWMWSIPVFSPFIRALDGLVRTPSLWSITTKTCWKHVYKRGSVTHESDWIATRGAQLQFSLWKLDLTWDMNATVNCLSDNDDCTNNPAVNIFVCIFSHMEQAKSHSWLDYRTSKMCSNVQWWPWRIHVP